ncbi:hypothetical protein [Rhodococcus sp. Q]|uniref:hypothetical protein n=1 Tax=Rhodococcus sp. Q TaxID=2502252 RepID=UPI0010F6D626|nr:hypothetical protein [Rhodococcus sp. Q]
MTTRASSYLLQAQTFVSDDDAADLESALAAARECEAAGEPYPANVRALVRVAWGLLEIDAPEVAAEFGPPDL